MDKRDAADQCGPLSAADLPSPSVKSPRYWAGFRRGVQRGVCGARLVPNIEHESRMFTETDPDEFAGYGDGLEFAKELLAGKPKPGRLSGLDQFEPSPKI
jgi:hypothetical protein